MEDRRRRRGSNQSDSDYSDNDDAGDAKASKQTGKDPEQVEYPEDASEYESITETYDDDTYDETTTEGGTEFTEDDVVVEGEYEESWIEEERQSGDGQEQSDDNKELSLDDDEDRKNPAYIPRKGAFYEHDDRLGEGDGQIATSPETKDTKEIDDKKQLKKKLWTEAEKWEHNKFVLTLQAPKSREEIIALYGYDIRAHSEPPEGSPRYTSRPRRGNRGRRTNKLQDYIHGPASSRSKPDGNQPRSRDVDPASWQPKRPSHSSQINETERTDTSDITPTSNDKSDHYQDDRRGDQSHSNNYQRIENDSHHDNSFKGESFRGRGGQRSRGRGGYRRGGAYDTGPSRNGQPRMSNRGHRGQSYSSLRSGVNRDGPHNRDSPHRAPDPPQPPRQWTENRSEPSKQDFYHQDENTSSRVPKSGVSWAKDTEDEYYVEDIIPPVTTPYTSSTRSNTTARNSRPEDDRQLQRRPLRKAASEDDLLEILPPTTTVYTATRPTRPADGPDVKGQSSQQGRPPKRYSSQRQRNLPENSNYMDGENLPPVSMVTGPGGMAPGYSDDGYNQRTRAPMSSRNTGPRRPPMARQGGLPRQQSPRQHSPRQPLHHSPRQQQPGVARPQHPGLGPQIPRGKMSPGGPRPSRPRQPSMFVRPRMNQSPPHTVTSFPQPPIIGAGIQQPLASIGYTIPGGSPVAGQAQLYTTTSVTAVTTHTSHLPHFINTPQPVLNYGPPPSARFQIPQGAVAVPLPAPVPAVTQEGVGVGFPPSSAVVTQAQEGIRVCGGTTYFSPEAQSSVPAQEGIHVRGGTTYFNPESQVLATNRQQFKRTKAAIPIVNPQMSEEDFYRSQGYSEFYPEGSQYEYSGQGYDFYGSFEEGGDQANEYSEDGYYDNPGAANQSGENFKSANQEAYEDDDECATPTNESVDSKKQSTDEVLAAASENLEMESRETESGEIKDSELTESIQQLSISPSDKDNGGNVHSKETSDIGGSPDQLQSTSGESSDQSESASHTAVVYGNNSEFVTPSFSEEKNLDTSPTPQTEQNKTDESTTEPPSVVSAVDDKESTPEIEEFSECVESLPENNF